MAKGKGRDRRREAQWRRIIREHTRSGLGVREFCRRGKLTETAFYFWRSELQRRQAEQEQRRQPTHRAQSRQVAVAPAFIPVQVASDNHAGTACQASPGPIEIVLSGGRRVHVTAPVDRAALADVLAVLEGRPC